MGGTGVSAMMKTKKVEHREFSRSSVSVRSQVRLQCGVLLEGRVCDVSMNGVRFITERSLPVGSVVRVSLTLGDPEGHEVRIDVAGAIARIVEKGVDIQFTSIDAESVEHLRNLVLFNAEDGDRVEREFDDHVGIRRK